MTDNDSGILDNNDNYTQLFIDIGRKDCYNIPKYIKEFFLALEKDTQGAFNLLDIAPSDATDLEHNEIVVTYTLLVDVKAPKYAEYCEGLENTDIYPFILGCGFEIVDIQYISYIPETLHNLAIDGDNDVIFYTKRLDAHLKQVLMEIFDQDVSTFELIDDYARCNGNFVMKRRLSTENISRFNDIMTKMGIKYELQKAI